MPEITPVLLQYYTELNVRAGDAMLYYDLINWTRVALRGVIFLEKKIINAMKLTEAYDKFRILVDPMNNWSHELDMGIKSLEQCMGREALEACFNQFFEDHGDLTSDAVQEHLHLFKEYVLGITFEHFEIEVVKVYQHGCIKVIHQGQCYSWAVLRIRRNEYIRKSRQPCSTSSTAKNLHR